MGTIEAAPAKADLHVHTSFSGWSHLRFIHPRECYSAPGDVYDTARGRGMDFVAITDHESIEGALRLRDERGVEAHRVIVGEELRCVFPETGQWVHVNVLGLEEEQHRILQKLKRDVRDVCAWCRERGLLLILNHPFQSYIGQKPLQSYIEDILSLFTHVEGLNGGVPSLQNRAVSALCRLASSEGMPLVQVGGSDGHTLKRVGKAYTEARASTGAGFLEEIKAGRCHPGGVNFSTPDLLRDVYLNVAMYYLRLYTGRGEARGPAAYAADVAVATACLPAAAGGLPAAIVLGSQLRQKAVSRAVIARLGGLNWGLLKAAAGASQ